jgi:hypothetical protein
MPDISPASETSASVGLFRVLEYSELNEAQQLFTVKSFTIQVVVETNTAEHQYRLFEYSELNEAQALSWTKVPPVIEEIDVTLGGGRSPGVFGPIMGLDFEIEYPAHASFSREFTHTAKIRRNPAIPATVAFAWEAPVRANFSQKVQFSYPGNRAVALHYNQVLRQDREILELMELGVL